MHHFSISIDHEDFYCAASHRSDENMFWEILLYKAKISKGKRERCVAFKKQGRG